MSSNALLTARPATAGVRGEIEAFRALEIGAAKWCKEHIPHKGNNLNDITDEGISLLHDAELWWEKQNPNQGNFINLHK